MTAATTALNTRSIEHEAPTSAPAPALGRGDEPSNDNDSAFTVALARLDQTHASRWAEAWEGLWQPALAAPVRDVRRELAARAIRWLDDHPHGFRWVRLWTVLELHAARYPHEVDRAEHLRAVLGWLSSNARHHRWGEMCLSVLRLASMELLPAEEFDVSLLLVASVRWLDVGPRSVGWAKTWRVVLPKLVARSLEEPARELIRLGFSVLLRDAEEAWWSDVWGALWKVRETLDSSDREQLRAMSRAWLAEHRGPAHERQRGFILKRLLNDPASALEVRDEARAWVERNRIDALCGIILARLAANDVPARADSDAASLDDA